MPKDQKPAILPDPVHLPVAEAPTDETRADLYDRSAAWLRPTDPKRAAVYDKRAKYLRTPTTKN